MIKIAEFHWGTLHSLVDFQNLFQTNQYLHYLYSYFDYLSELSVNTTSGPSLLGEKETNLVREGLVVEFWRETSEAFERIEVFRVRVDPVLLAELCKFLP